MYATSEGIYSLYFDPAVTGRPFPPITTVSRTTAFDVSYENKTLFVVGDRKLKKVALGSNEAMDLVTTINISGSFCAYSSLAIRTTAFCEM